MVAPTGAFFGDTMTETMEEALHDVIKVTKYKFLTSKKEQVPLEKRLQWLDTIITSDLARETAEFKHFYTVLLSHLVGIRVDLIITSPCCKNRRYTPNFYGLGTYDDYSQCIINNISTKQYEWYLGKTGEFRKEVLNVPKESNHALVYISCPRGCELFSRDDIELLKNKIKKEFRLEFDHLVKDIKDDYNTLIAYTLFFVTIVYLISMPIFQIYRLFS